MTQPANHETAVQVRYMGVQLAHYGETCKIIHQGQTISRVQFADGSQTAAFNTDLFKAGL